LNLSLADWLMASPFNRRPRSYRADLPLKEVELVTFTIPGNVGREAALAVAALHEASRRQDHAMMLAARPEWAGPNPLSTIRELEEVVDRYTAPIGWSALWILRPDRGDRLDTFLAWRHLEFVRFQIEVRSAIVERINEALRRVGRRIGFATQVSITQVSNQQDVDNPEELFARGFASLGEVFRMQA
jgi:hypothetical protein